MRVGTAVAAVGAQTRALRRARGWTLEQAAEHAGLDLRHLQKVEAGRTTPTLATLLRIADGLGVAPARLLETIGAAARATSYEVAAGAREGVGPRGVVDAKEGDASGRVGAIGEGTRRPEDPERVLARMGSRVASLRKARRWTQGDLATRADVAVPHLQRVEAGRQNATARVLARIAGALGVSVADLFAET